MIIIDGSNYIFSQLFEKNFNKTYEDLIRLIFSKIKKTIMAIDNSIYSNYNDDKIFFIIDGNMIAEHRKELSEEYKSFKHNFDLNDELIFEIRKTISDYDLYEERNDKYQTYFSLKLLLLENFDLYAYKYAPKIDIRLCFIEFAEGDDVISILRNKNHKSIICSSDRDFLQLAKEGTIIYNGKNFVDNVDDDYVIIKGIMGDEADNIKGYEDSYHTYGKAKKLFEKNHIRMISNEQLIDLSGQYFYNDYKVKINQIINTLK